MYAVSTLHLVTIYKHTILIINASLRHPSFLRLMQISIQRYELRFAHAVIYFVSLRVKETSLRETNPEVGSTRSKGRNLKTLKGPLTWSLHAWEYQTSWRKTGMNDFFDWSIYCCRTQRYTHQFIHWPISYIYPTAYSQLKVLTFYLRKEWCRVVTKITMATDGKWW